MVFIKKNESFTCEHCGISVEGNGYTNHCPRCLWGKHVDVYPGDRMESCGGIMEPVAVTKKNSEDRILHRCTVCGFERENRISDEDDREAVFSIVKESSDRMFKTGVRK